MTNPLSVDKKQSSNETKLQKATDGGCSKAQQPTPQQTQKLNVHAWAAEAKIAEAVKAKAMKAEAMEAAKGQLISKAIYGLLISPKKRTDEFVLFYSSRQTNQIRPFIFW